LCLENVISQVLVGLDHSVPVPFQILELEQTDLLELASTSLHRLRGSDRKHQESSL